MVGLEPTAIINGLSFHKYSLGAHCLLDTGGSVGKAIGTFMGLNCSLEEEGENTGKQASADEKASL